MNTPSSTQVPNSLSLKDMQRVSLMLLEKLHSFCITHDIRYSLAYGTLLGAVRHKGFIPWDDDIDIMMFRPDYERFCNTFHAEGVSLYCHQNNPDCYIAYARICDDVFTVSARNSWLRGGGHTGLWIDIFPIDNVPDDPEEYRALYNKTQQPFYKLFKYRVYMNGYDKRNSFKCNMVAACLHVWPIQQIMAHHTARLFDKYIKDISNYPFGSTAHYSQLALPGNVSKQYLHVDYFKHFVLLDFEGRQFYAAEDYDDILRCVYGDYMQLPPENQRVPQHQGQSFYWLDSSVAFPYD